MPDCLTVAHWCDNHIQRGAPGWGLIDFGCGRGRPHGSMKPLLPSAKLGLGAPRHLCSLSVFVGPILLYFEHSSSGDVVRDLLQEALAFLEASSERLDKSFVSLAPLHLCCRLRVARSRSGSSSETRAVARGGRGWEVSNAAAEPFAPQTER